MEGLFDIGDIVDITYGPVDGTKVGLVTDGLLEGLLVGMANVGDRDGAIVG